MTFPGGRRAARPDSPRAARRATSTFYTTWLQLAILHDGAFAVPTPGNTALRQADEITPLLSSKVRLLSCTLYVIFARLF